MRRIYRREAWMDTESPNKRTREKITDEQKRVLNNWLRSDSPFRQDLTSEPVEERQTRARSYEDDDLRDLLENSDDWLTSEECCDRGVKDAKIASCSVHLIQPESVIVEKALEKMKNLSDEEEEHYKKLLQDYEFMNFLNDQIKRYLDNCR